MRAILLAALIAAAPIAAAEAQTYPGSPVFQSFTVGGPNGQKILGVGTGPNRVAPGPALANEAATARQAESNAQAAAAQALQTAINGLVAANNLSDLPNPGAARGALGLGTAAPGSIGGVAMWTDPRIVGALQTGAALDTNTVLGRTLAARAGEVINVLDNGVKCDGATDNASALVNAVAKLANGGVLYFPPAPAKCLTSANLVLPSNTTVTAMPGTVTLAPYPGSTANPILISAANVSNVLIYGLVLDGGGQDFANSNNIATVYKAKNVVFDHDTFQNSSGLGALFSTSVTISGIRDSRIVNIGNHWKTTGAGADQKQGVAFCCGTVLQTSAAQQSSNIYALAFSATTGLAVGQLVTVAGVPPGTYIQSLTGTTVYLSQPSASLVPNGAGVSFSTNHGNFAQGNFFDDIGLDALSVAEQIGFSASGNHYRSVGGQYSNGGASVYAASVDKLSVRGEISVGSFGNGLDVIHAANSTLCDNDVSRAGSSGLSLAGSQHVTVCGNSYSDNNQNNGASGASSGVVLFSLTNEAPLSDIVVSANTATDMQGTKTQLYGAQIIPYGPYANVWIDPSNRFAGNVNGELGGGLAYALPASATWATYVPNVTAGDGAGVGLNAGSLSYSLAGKALILQGQISIKYTTKPSTFTISLPSGVQCSGYEGASGFGVSSNIGLSGLCSGSAIKFVASSGATPFANSNDYFTLAFSGQVQ